VDELYNVARRVLLDALEALGVHLDAVVVVGAQAIYLRVGEADLAVAAFTTDGDLGIEPTLLANEPALEAALQHAKLEAPTGSNVGIWTTEVILADRTVAKVCIDLLVPRGISPDAGKRAAPLKGHHALAARAVVGLEGVVVDHDRMTIGAFEEGDTRSLEVRVAGPAALLVAKVHKIAEREGSARQKDKDALDVLRLLRGVPFEDLAQRLRLLLIDERSAKVTEGALELLPTLFGRRGAEGVNMALRATEGLADPDEIEASCQLLTLDLLQLLDR
jgi:hypothetical protein